MRCVIDGSNTSMFSLSNQVGIGSNEHDLVGVLEMISESSSTPIHENVANGSPLNAGKVKELTC